MWHWVHKVAARRTSPCLRLKGLWQVMQLTLPSGSTISAGNELGGLNPPEKEACR